MLEVATLDKLFELMNYGELSAAEEKYLPRAVDGQGPRRAAPRKRWMEAPVLAQRTRLLKSSGTAAARAAKRLPGTPAGRSSI